MSTVEALLNAVRRDPEDRLPWLVLADWLEDRGYPTDAARVRAHAAGDGARTLIARGWDLPLPAVSADCWCELVADLGVAREYTLDLTRPDPAEGVTDRGLVRLATVRAPYLESIDISWTAVTDEAVLRLLWAPGFRDRWWLDWFGVDLGYRTWSRKDRARLMAHTLPDWERKEECDGGCGQCRGCARQVDHAAERDRSVDPPHDPGENEAWDRADRDNKGTGRPGRSRKTWWGGFQVSQLSKRRRRCG